MKETNGWFPPKFLKTVRNFMKAKLRVMLGEADAQGLEYLLSGDEEDEEGKEKKEKVKDSDAELPSAPQVLLVF